MRSQDARGALEYSSCKAVECVLSGKAVRGGDGEWVWWDCVRGKSG